MREILGIRVFNPFSILTGWKPVVLLLFTFISTYAQEKPKEKSIKGYVNQTEFGVLLGRGAALFAYTGQSKTNFTFQTFNGYRFSKLLSVGAVVGVDWYSSYQIVPVEVGVRLDFKGDKRVFPYLGFDAGYGAMWLNTPASGYTLKGGFTANPSAGLKIDLGKESYLTLSVGYKYQKASSKFVGDFDYIVDNQNEYNRFSVRTGVSF